MCNIQIVQSTNFHSYPFTDVIFIKMFFCKTGLEKNPRVDINQPTHIEFNVPVPHETPFLLLTQSKLNFLSFYTWTPLLTTKNVKKRGRGCKNFLTSKHWAIKSVPVYTWYLLVGQGDSFWHCKKCHWWVYLIQDIPLGKGWCTHFERGCGRGGQTTCWREWHKWSMST